MSISAKKLDYLIEDLSYKSEKISPALDSLINLLNYIDLLDNVVKNEGIKLVNSLLEDKRDLELIVKQLREFINKHRTLNKIDNKNKLSTKDLTSKN